MVALLAGIASTFVYVYQKPRDRSVSVTIVSIITVTCLLATILLLPVDIALVSSTVSSKLGQRKEWATQQKVDDILYSLTIIYYTLFSADALLCLLVIPFTYFLHEEYDEVESEEGRQTLASRLWGASKYTIGFLVLIVIIFLVGLFLPVGRPNDGKYDLDYIRKLLGNENNGERALTFALGLLTTIGTLLYVLYTGAGLALLPVALIKSAPVISAPALTATTESELAANRERQRQLEGRATGNEAGLNSKDRRELDALVREERTLVRRQRLAAEASGEKEGWFIRAWHKIEAIFRPVKLLGGILLLVVTIVIWISMLITGIDKASNSVCKHKCGYILAHVNLFNPVNSALVESSRIFPIDYVIFLLITMLFFFSSVIGIATIGIRFLWLRLFDIRKGRTSPQAMLMATVMLTLIALAINYSLAMMVAPQYSHFGSQKFCNHRALPGEQPDCSTHPNHIIPCTEIPTYSSATNVCTPSVASTFLDRITINFSFFGIVEFWAQFFFLGMSPLCSSLNSNKQ